MAVDVAGAMPPVVLWPGEGPASILASEVIGVSLAGVAIGEAPGRTGDAAVVREVISWDRVRAIDPALTRDRHAEFIGLAESTWRARTRLERGDAISAEPLFEAAFARLAGQAGPTPALVAEGLLRCRLRRGALASAVPVWLALLGSGVPAWAARDTGGSDYAPMISGLGPVVDGATGLVPGLPPIWIDGPAVASFAGVSTIESLVGEAPDERAAAIAGVYVASARASVGLVFDDGAFVVAERMGASDFGVRLCWAVAASEHPDASVRARALSELQAMVSDIERRRAGDAGDVPPVEPGAFVDDRWVEAWVRTAIGLVLTRGPDAATRRLGVLSLVHVPARFGEEASYLSGVCLARASETVRALGNADAASALLSELSSRYADHPLLSVGVPASGPVPEDPAS